MSGRARIGRAPSQRVVCECARACTRSASRAAASGRASPAAAAAAGMRRVGSSSRAVNAEARAADVKPSGFPAWFPACNITSAAPEAANAWYEEVAAVLRGHGLTVETGRFQSHMQVDLCNDGPVTLLLDSQKQF